MKVGLEMGNNRYVAGGTEYDEELSRLQLQASFTDPVTIRHLWTIGISEGWRVLEVGAGAGSIVQWLSQRVGPTGRVVATDIDMRFLQRINAPNLETRRHDILKDGLETGHYDLAHCRKLLMHLPDPEKGLKRMANAIRPGGWLLVEEDDYGSSLSADVADPSATVFAKTLRVGLDFLRKSGIVDPYFGRRVRGLVEHLGFTDIGQEGWTTMNRGGDLMARLDAASWRFVAKPVMAAGLYTQEDYDNLQRAFLDPSFSYPGLTLFSAWGRKPED